jgi:hypothetical protein
MINKARDYMKYYLYESGIFNEKELSNLSTDSLNDSIREVASLILGSIIEKSDKVNTTPIDKSKGDIKYLPDLESLQMAINQLETMIDRSASVDSTLIRYLKEIERALLNINKYSPEFKEAYRSRKTLLILKYQSLIMSVFSALSYLISVMVDFSTGDIRLKNNVEYDEIFPLKNIVDFNRSVERGEFKSLIKEVSMLREEFLEVTPESLELLEAYDLSTILMDGIKMFYNSFANNPKLIDFLYKFAGIVTILMSLREVFYMFFKAKSRLEDVVGHVGNFANSSNGSSALLAKLNTFSNKYVVDAEESTKMAQREIESENKSLRQEVQAIPRLAAREPEKAAEVVDQGFEDLGFGF